MIGVGRPGRWRGVAVRSAAFGCLATLSLMAAGGAPGPSGVHAEPRLQRSTVGMAVMGAGGDCSTEPDGEWTTLSQVGAPAARYGHTAVWTGQEMLVWGHAYFPNPRDDPGDPGPSGGRYNPRTDTWRAMSEVGAPPALPWALSVWTGTEMLVWSRRVDFAGIERVGGGRYNPTSDTWRPLSTAGGPIAGGDAASFLAGHAVWDGQEMLVLSPVRTVSPRSRMVELYRYDPASDAWTPASPVPISDFAVAAAQWTGTGLLTVGERLEGTQFRAFTAGAIWDRAADVWTVVSDQGAPSPRVSAAAAWTGTTLFVWGGEISPGYFGKADGGMYLADRDQWVNLPSADAPSRRWDAVGAWTGRDFLVWGGNASDDTRLVIPRDDGGLFRPSTGTWRALPSPPLRQRFWGPAVWTGDRLLVWGGTVSLGTQVPRGPAINEGLSYLPPC